MRIQILTEHTAYRDFEELTILAAIDAFKVHTKRGMHFTFYISNDKWDMKSMGHPEQGINFVAGHTYKEGGLGATDWSRNALKVLAPYEGRHISAEALKEAFTKIEKGDFTPIKGPDKEEEKYTEEQKRQISALKYVGQKPHQDLKHPRLMRDIYSYEWRIQTTEGMKLIDILDACDLMEFEARRVPGMTPVNDKNKADGALPWVFYVAGSQWYAHTALQAFAKERGWDEKWEG